MAFRKDILTLIAGLFFSLLVPVIGQYYLGALHALLFLIGYGTGLIFWLVVPYKASWKSLKAPYWLTVLVFLLLHKVEENRMRFFEVVSSKITGAQVPQLSVES